LLPSPNIYNLSLHDALPISDYVRDLVEAFTHNDQVSPLFRKRPADPVGAVGATWWTHDESIDFEYHVRHAALPEPRRIRELLQRSEEHTSELQSRENLVCRP